jgi:hypothetical protein
MGAANRCYASGMTRRAEPVAYRRADCSALRGLAFALAWLAGDQEQDSEAHRNRLFETAVEKRVGRSEAVAVKVNDEVRLDEAAREAAVPGAVESRAGLRNGSLLDEF